MFASEEPTKWNKAAEIGTWVLLFFVLIPGTTLAYFAETSLPNTPLYPVKRNIESTILALSSFNTATKSLYQLNLARTRLQETQQIVSLQGITSDNLAQFNTVMAQLTQANDSINTVSDPVQKAQMQQQLHQTAAAYKQQLTHIQQQLQNSSATPPASSNDTSPNTANTNSSVNDSPNNNASTDESPSLDTSPNLIDLSPQDKATLQQTILNINNELDTMDTTTPQPPDQTQPPTQTPTPTPQSHHHNEYNGNQDHSGDGSFGH